MASEAPVLDALMESKRRRQEILIKFLEMLKAMQSQLPNDVKQEKAFKVLGTHVKRGGNLLSHEIPIEDAALFGQILQANKIPYVSSTVYSPESNKHVTLFTTRDTDSAAVNKAREMYTAEQKAGMSELSMLEFTQIADGRDVDVREGLDASELQLFRHYMGRESVPFAVREVSEGKFDIFVTKEHTKVVDDNLKRVAFDFSGNSGEILKKEMDEGIANRSRFVHELLQNPPGERLYAVDTKNPGRFICIDDSSFVMHNLQQVDEMLGDSVEQTVVKDTSVEVFAKERVHDLETLVDQLFEPVILKESEMPLVSEILPNGAAIPVTTEAPEMAKQYQGLLQAITGRPDRYQHKCISALKTEQKTALNLLDLPKNVIEQAQAMQQSGQLLRTSIVNNTMSYTMEDKPKIDELLANTLYKGLKGVELTKARMHYEGRGEFDYKQTAEPLYLLNADAPDFVLKLDEVGLTIYRDDISQGPPIERESPEFESKLEEMLGIFPNIVVLNSQEFHSERKLDIAKQRLPKEQNHEARAFLFDNIDKEREDLVNGTMKEPTQRQIAAEKRHQMWGYVEYHVDKDIITKKVEPEKAHQMTGYVEYQNDVAGHKVEELRNVERPGSAGSHGSMPDIDMR